MISLALLEARIVILEREVRRLKKEAEEFKTFIEGFRPRQPDLGKLQLREFTGVCTDPRRTSGPDRRPARWRKNVKKGARR